MHSVLAQVMFLADWSWCFLIMGYACYCCCVGVLRLRVGGLNFPTVLMIFMDFSVGCFCFSKFWNGDKNQLNVPH